MKMLLPLASLLGIEVNAVADRAKSLALAYGAIGILLILAVGFLVGAGYMALAEAIGPILAALLFSGAFFLISLVVYLLVQAGEGRRRRRTAEKRKSSETGALITSAALTALPMVLRAPGVVKFGLPAAALAAFALLRENDDRD